MLITVTVCGRYISIRVLCADWPIRVQVSCELEFKVTRAC